MEIMPKLIAADAFFADHYRSLAESSTRLARLIVQFKTSPLLEWDIQPLVGEVQAICAATIRSLGVTADAPQERTIAGLMKTLTHVIEIAGQAKADAGVVQAAEQLEIHKSYFLKAFNVKSDYKNAIFSSRSSKQVFYEMCFNVTNVIFGYVFNQYQLASADPRVATSFFDFGASRKNAPAPSRAVIEACRSTLDGWCSDDKTWLLYHLIREARPLVAVEIGIYGGRSIVPMAQAMKDNGFGTVTGIEAWSASASTEQVTGLANDFWWSCLDYSVFKAKFFNFVAKHELFPQIKVIEATSSIAHHCIGEIDFLHIDGNHSAFSAAQDVINYFPKLKHGGILVFDDINWPSTHPALEIVRGSTQLLHVTPVAEGSTIPGCAAFRKL